MFYRWCILMLLLIQSSAFAQREFGICDSTTYEYNNDTSIIAGRNRLYLRTNNSTNLLYNFSTADPDEYIRDFDIVKPNLWYTVVGRRYIGSNTNLYKSTDKGITWTIDTNHYLASNAQFLDPQFLKSINYLQHLNGDTLLMFMSYYDSGILYSTDAGQTWTKWFNNLITHYQGMLECGNKYYIYGFEGDAFRSWMFGFNKQLLFTSDSGGAWNIFRINSYHPNCNKFDTVNCIYAPYNATRCGSYTYYKNYIDSICSLTGINEIKPTEIQIYPNPSKGMYSLKFSENTDLSINAIEVFDVIGNKCKVDAVNMNGVLLINIQNLSPGLYFLRVHHNNKQQTFKLIKEH